ncbi:MFS transporter, MHS family, proline/betaine transporter [Streptosporangium subroseum]|uniref:MFS transporter, MHS family, proline/betaine transporter n=1 Tax=Streptosporangium subroseum TaxID=106412 RepID=A0A239NRN3_9ACTN|nr:MFS transporter [Streptosporangium subroseum]SNT57410.1 MFS transporter, MHS family, proline/betaine transporter [Streptosporangium subroseum]SNT60968.1 MFS transporter, MHS family, proline/betaine transporter [Streptosporangium subroseum]
MQNPTDDHVIQTTKPRPRTVAALVLGHFIEVYDTALYGLFVAPIATAFFPAGNADAALIATLAVFGVSFLSKSAGGLFFGVLADRVGRRNSLMASILLVGGSTAAIGLIPTYETAALLSPILLVVCRLLQGFASGGEATVAPVFLGEYASRKRRGFITSFVAAAGNLGTLVAAATGVIVGLSVNESTFNDYGWRFAFLIAAPLALFALYLRYGLEEPVTYQKARSRVKPAPIRTALRHWRMILRVSCLGALGTTFYIMFVYYPTYLVKETGLSASDSRIVPLILISLLVVFNPLVGMLGDRYGRKLPLLLGGLASVLFVLPGFLVAQSGGFLAAVLGGVLILISVPLCLGSIHAISMEFYPTEVRATAAGIAGTLGTFIFAGLPPVIVNVLTTTYDMPLAPAFVIVGTAVLGLIAAWGLPDTRKIDLETVGTSLAGTTAESPRPGVPGRVAS